VAVAIFGFAIGVLLSIVTSSIAEEATNYHASSSGPVPVAVTAANLAGLWIGLVGAAVWWSRNRGTGRLATDFGYRLGAWWDIPLGVVVGLGCQYVLIPLLYRPFEVADRKLAHQLSQPTEKTVGAAHTSAAVTVVLLFIAVGAPLVEELYFRGLLLRSLAAWVNPLVGVLVSGVLFGLAHFEKLQFAGLALFGVILGYMAWRLKRLGPGIAAHISFNAVAVLSTVHLH
jgi:membrane protease YdiL (CAAX protease family)